MTIAAKTAYAKEHQTHEPEFYISNVKANQLLSTFPGVLAKSDHYTASLITTLLSGGELSTGLNSMILCGVSFGFLLCLLKGTRGDCTHFQSCGGNSMRFFTLIALSILNVFIDDIQFDILIPSIFKILCILIIFHSRFNDGLWFQRKTDLSSARCTGMSAC